MSTASPAPLSEAAAADAFRRALRDMLVMLGILLVLGVGIGALTAGWPGVWGALIGVGLALIFSGTTVVSVLRTVNTTPAHTTAVIMGAWLGKIVVVFIALAVLSRFDFYNRMVLGLVLFAGVLGSAVLDLRAVQRGRIPYIEPKPTQGPTGEPVDGSGPAVS
ncbi:hypothetical protein IC607_12640 [Cellulomonas sp. JH27-2]|uniref:hypothetical protein n=1 Tax=Cellulomonas sp. JH27-2 TaxID=2774139 RepID=UPI001782D413|nr:hypothetical protein [Cellulomonas sp. JH27-2]MBD8059815.1 hypothetical protein [Cellulomonas sp. JH27-2]